MVLFYEPKLSFRRYPSFDFHQKQKTETLISFQLAVGS